MPPASLTAKRQEANLDRSLSYLRPLVVDDLARFGSVSEGGYLVPSSAPDRDACFYAFFGLGLNWTLELALYDKRNDIVMHVYDHTKDMPRWIIDEIVVRAIKLEIGFGGVKCRYSFYKEYSGSSKEILGTFIKVYVHVLCKSVRSMSNRRFAGCLKSNMDGFLFPNLGFL